MPNPTWPAALPQNPFGEDRPQYKRGSNILRSQMESGPPKQRRRFTAVFTSFEFTLKLSTAQWTALNTFYTDTVKCVLPFDWVDFRNGAAATYTFVAAPEETYFAGSATDGWWEVKVQVEMQP